MTKNYAYTIRPLGCTAWAQTDCLSRAGFLAVEARGAGLARVVVVDAAGEDQTGAADEAWQEECDGATDCDCVECAEGSGVGRNVARGEDA